MFLASLDPNGGEAARRLRLQLIPTSGTFNLVMFFALLLRAALSAPPEGPPIPIYALAALFLIVAVLVWVLPWGRLPLAALLGWNLLAVGLTTTLLFDPRYPVFQGFFFLWIGFAAIAYRLVTGLLVSAIVAVSSLASDFASAGWERLFQQLLVVVPCYLAFYLICRFFVVKLYWQHDATSRARGEGARLAALYDFSTLLSKERDLDRLLNALVRGLADRFGYRYVSAFLLLDGRLQLRAQVGYETPLTDLALGEGITGLVGDQGQPLLVRDGREHPNYLLAEAHFGSQASVPLLHGGRVVGVLNLEAGVDELLEDDLRLLETLAGPAAIAIENAALLARLADQAHRDHLTGLPNRRGIVATLEGALHRPGRQAGTAWVTVLLVDLNGFKAVNDCYGHAAGDVLLGDLARLLSGAVRAGDTVGRLGGDEFLVVMPGADEFAALGVVERLSAAIAAYAFPLRAPDQAPPPAVGYSLGLASAPADGDDAETLLRVADDAMYRAKRGGAGPIRFLARERAGTGPLTHRP